MIFESEKKIYDTKSDRYISEWSVDTDTQTVWHTDSKTLETKEREFYTDHIRYHLHYSEEYVPDRLQKLVNEGKILEYLEDLEEKITDAINDQTDILMRDCKEYQIALESGNLKDVGSIGNMLREMAKDGIYKAMVYV